MLHIKAHLTPTAIQQCCLCVLYNVNVESHTYTQVAQNCINGVKNEAIHLHHLIYIQNVYFLAAGSNRKFTI